MGWNVRMFEKDGIAVTLIDVESIDGSLKSLIDDRLLSICEGNSIEPRSLNEMKSFLINNIINQEKFGSIAEFFIHLYLGSESFKQECFFINMEEPKSYKKGFDGVYTKNDIEWIMESKSGLSTTENITHKGKLIEAYKDLNDKFDGRVSNNPWQNAYNHASHIDINSSLSLRRKLKNYANNWDKKEFPSIGEFNIIPSSSIFIVCDYKGSRDEELLEQIYTTFIGKDYKQIQAICCTHGSIDAFIDYIKEGSIEY